MIKEYQREKAEVDKLVKEIHQEQLREAEKIEDVKRLMRTNMEEGLFARKRDLEMKAQEEAEYEAQIKAYRKMVLKRNDAHLEREKAMEASRARIRARLEE